MLKILHDNSGEVQNLGVKCICRLIERCRETSAERIVDNLSQELVGESTGRYQIELWVWMVRAPNTGEGRFLAALKLQKRTTPRILKISGIVFACDREGNLALFVWHKN